MTKQSAKWQPIRSGYYIDPVAMRDAQLEQSAATKDGKVAPFQIWDCPQGETPIRERAYTPEQEAARHNKGNEELR